MSDQPTSKTIYTVREQYPHTEIVCFFSLSDAQSYVSAHRAEFIAPLITSRTIRKDS